MKTLKGEEVISIDEEDRIAKPGFLNQAKCFLSGIDRPSSSIKNWVSYEEALTSMKVVDAIFAGQ